MWRTDAPPLSPVRRGEVSELERSPGGTIRGRLTTVSSHIPVTRSLAHLVSSGRYRGTLSSAWLPIQGGQPGMYKGRPGRYSHVLSILTVLCLTLGIPRN